MNENRNNLNTALANARERLLSELSPSGRWEGRLSSSALATAVAVVALRMAGRTGLADRGLQWLRDNRNEDGGWGDSPESPSNFTTTLLCRCALDENIGSARETADSILQFYGNDSTFSVPILTMCMLTGKLGNDWGMVPQLPFELAVFPHRFYRFLRLPVVSYALPALIAIGLVRHQKKPIRFLFYRSRLIDPALKILLRIQPQSGGFLEAAPLTSFVAMSLIGAGFESHPVTQNCLRFLETTVREDGSWAIDVNLSTWVTSLSARALDDVLTEQQKTEIRKHLLSTQWKVEHPFTHAAPGGWGWTDSSGAVPDADDTSAALIALRRIGGDNIPKDRVESGIRWLLNLQNRDGGMPTFCKGWGRLPFDRSCPDLTAHAIRAFFEWKDVVDVSLGKKMERSICRGLRYLEKEQRADGSWLPLWFGNQHNKNHENPVYGTVRVLEALIALDDSICSEIRVMKERGLHWLQSVKQDTNLSVEETALQVSLTGQGVEHLLAMTKIGTEFPAAPIGLYFASLWYSEQLYPIVFTVEALRMAKEACNE